MFQVQNSNIINLSFNISEFLNGTNCKKIEFLTEKTRFEKLTKYHFIFLIIMICVIAFILIYVKYSNVINPYCWQ